MASSLASYDTGYEDELFQYPVGPSLHCCICTNVIKDPVMCQNEHIFCRVCITRHLMYSETCPTCMQPLTVETLRQATRGIRNLLSELKIRCEFVHRGCGKIVDLGDLERHVADCGFAPAVCSNEGCQLEVNKQDLLHHETAVCELRRVQCHSCNDIRREMNTVKVNLESMNEKLQKNVKRIEEKLDRTEESVKALEANVVGQVQEQLKKQEESNRQLKTDNAEMKKSLDEITKHLVRMTQQISHGVQDEQLKKGIAEAGGVDREPKVVLAGGYNNQKRLNSVEMFSLATGTWTQLQPMGECRDGGSAVVYNNQTFVATGYHKSMEKLSLNAVHVDQSIPWEIVRAELPGRLAGHCSVVYKGRLVMIGGYDADKFTYSNSIIEFPLVSPCNSKLLASMPQARCYHGAAIFGDKIVIVGGRECGRENSTLSSVIMYDIIKNEFQELAPLPYPVCTMATVKWGDTNVMIIGGVDNQNKRLNKVLMYNIKSQKSHELPEMKFKRKGCAAAVVNDTVIVMGGKDEINYLKSVESFTFDRYSWEELADMREPRYRATAVTC